LRKALYVSGVLLMGAGIVSGSLAGMSCAGVSPSTAGDQVSMDILNSSMSYIKANHPDAAQFISDDISFTLSGSTGKDIEGYSGVTYKGGGWVVSIGHAIVPNYAWGIKADYDSGKIVWIGTSKNGRITEESYTKSN
jgi:hypothetical protein